MKRTMGGTGAALAACGAVISGMLQARRAPGSPSAPPSSLHSIRLKSDATSDGTGAIVAAAPGRVEAISEEIRVASQIGGRLQQVLVDEGDGVARGQVLAVIENADFRARVASAEATLQLRQADARRVHAGARDQERRDAEAAVREASAVLDNVRLDVNRRRDLFRETVISRAELDKSEEQLGVAQGRLGSAGEGPPLAHAGAWRGK